MKLSDFAEAAEIQKGWSADRKYCVKDEIGKRYMFRLSASEQYDRKKAEFERMQKVQALGVAMCEPIEFGICEDGVYMVQGWIEGVDAREVLPTLTDAQAYDLGVEAGKIMATHGKNSIVLYGVLSRHRSLLPEWWMDI